MKEPRVGDLVLHNYDYIPKDASNGKPYFCGHSRVAGKARHVVDDDQLDAEIAATAGILKRTSPDAMLRIRQSIDGATTTGFVDQLGIEMEHQAVLIPRNMTEGAQAFLEKREPQFDGRRTGSE